MDRHNSSGESVQGGIKVYEHIGKLVADDELEEEFPEETLEVEVDGVGKLLVIRRK